MNLPNCLTLLRLALVPLVPVLFSRGLPFWALAVYLAAGVTDILDGYLARKLNQITKFGKIVDPFADKLMLVVTLSCLYAYGYIPVWALVLALVKEALMIAGALVLYRIDVVIAANFFGKAATFLFTPAVALSFFGQAAYPWHWILLALSAAYVAMLQYGLLFLRALREGKKKPKNA